MARGLPGAFGRKVTAPYAWSPLMLAFVVPVVDWRLFFKQKPAYEISPRDWSSDVCSSDLKPRSVAASYALSVRRTARATTLPGRYLLDPLALSGSYATGNARSDLSFATASSYALTLDYVLGFVRRGSGVRLLPTGFRLRSSLAGEDGSRASYAVPVERPSDSLVTPARSRTRVWRNNGRIDFTPLRSVELRMDVTSLRDL